MHGTRQPKHLSERSDTNSQSRRYDLSTPCNEYAVILSTSTCRRMNIDDVRILPCSLRACSLASFSSHSDTRPEKKHAVALPPEKNTPETLVLQAHQHHSREQHQQKSSLNNPTTQLKIDALSVNHLFCMSLGTIVHLVYIYIYIIFIINCICANRCREIHIE